MAFDDTDHRSGGGGGGNDPHNPPDSILHTCIEACSTTAALNGYCTACTGRLVSVIMYGMTLAAEAIDNMDHRPEQITDVVDLRNRVLAEYDEARDRFEAMLNHELTGWVEAWNETQRERRNG